MGEPDAAVQPEVHAIVDRLGLVPNPLGGWFRQVHESPPPSGSGRPVATVITYLLDAVLPTTVLHRMSADAIHYFHQGCPLALITVSPAGRPARHVLGSDLDDGQSLQVVVPGGTWKAFELVGGPWALISEAVAPGWMAADQEEATPALYTRDHPDLADTISRFVR